MKAQTRTTRSARTRIAAQGVVALLTVGGLLTAGAGSAQAATSVGLGTAGNFGVLAGSAVTNTGPTTITGDVGVWAGTAISGFPPGSIVAGTGVIRSADDVARQAQTDLVTAYNDAAGRLPITTIPTELAGSTLKPGFYVTSAGDLLLTGTLTLDGENDASALFVFKAASTLTTISASRVALINGAQPCNVFWQIGRSATLGTGTQFVGNILAMTSITATTGATVDGRLLARNGAVTLDTNTITRSTCSTPSTGDTSGSTTSAYAANIGPLAQGLVCPWGGVYNGGGLCVGTGANSLMNPSPTSTTPTTTSTTPTTTSTTPTTTSTTPTTTSTTPTTTPAPTISPKPTAGPVPGEQVPKKPSGGVGTGDGTTG